MTMKGCSTIMVINDLLHVTVYYEENRILREQSELEDRESNDNMEM